METFWSDIYEDSTDSSVDSVDISLLTSLREEVYADTQKNLSDYRLSLAWPLIEQERQWEKLFSKLINESYWDVEGNVVSGAYEGMG